MTTRRARDESLPLHIATYGALLTLLGFLSWLGDGWGYLALYGIVLSAFAAFVGAPYLVQRRRFGPVRASRFLARCLRSFARAQITLAVVIVATAVVARFSSGPLGPFPGGVFRGTASDQPFDDGLDLGGGEIQLTVPADPPYTITTHAFLIDGSLYVGADFLLPFKRWVHIVEDGDVILRVAGRLYRRSAVRIRDPGDQRRILEGVSRQRGVDPDDWLTEVWSTLR